MVKITAQSNTTHSDKDVQVLKFKTVMKVKAANGKGKVIITCPFCYGSVTAYLWSLAGGGKRCACGALLHKGGNAARRNKDDKTN